MINIDINVYIKVFTIMLFDFFFMIKKIQPVTQHYSAGFSSSQVTFKYILNYLKEGSKYMCNFNLLTWVEGIKLDKFRYESSCREAVSLTQEDGDI